MANKHRVSRMEERLTPTKDCTVFRTQTIRVTEKLTRAEHQVFMDRHKGQDNHEGNKVVIWRLFIVGMPTDPIAGRLGDVNT